MARATDNLQQEVTHLLNFVKSSSCIFIRNGDEHSAKDAAKHIQRKYEHYEDDIQTAEQFIELSATKSTMSGDIYHVKCNGVKQTSQGWLTNELYRFRAQQENLQPSNAAG